MHTQCRHENNELPGKSHRFKLDRLVYKESGNTINYLDQITSIFTWLLHELGT